MRLFPRPLRDSQLATVLATALTCFPGDALASGALRQANLDEESPSSVVLNVRDFGAIGDGKIHPVKEWLKSPRFRSLAALQQEYPFVDSPEWSADEVAFAAALRELPPAGGTIHFPTGHYVAAKQPWKIWRDNVRLTGDGADRTILSTAATVAEALSLAPYRHVGWLEGAEREYSFVGDSGRRGDAGVQLTEPRWTREFQRGELVFIRSGANRFDQDYGEFNEIAGADAEGRLRFKFPLSRDYTVANVNWATETAEMFTMPDAEAKVRVVLRTGEGFTIPPPRSTISIGDSLFTVGPASAVASAGGADVQLLYRGRGSARPGYAVPAGAKVAKARSILKLTRTTRNFRCENLQIIGRRKTVNLSNSYNSSFADCIFVRDARDPAIRGGLTIDGDGGRFARFERCKLIARPAAGMQFARSFGSVLFSGCTFVDANAAFTEFNFDCEVSRCTFEITGGPSLANVIIIGKSCGDIRVLQNEIRATGVATVFDTHSDIQSQKHNSEGDLVVRGNTIRTDGQAKLFSVPRSTRVQAEANDVGTR